jgi:tetratricopeptide (TPR) repeat protein
MPDRRGNIGGVDFSDINNSEIKTGDITTNVNAEGDIIGGDKNIFMTYIQMIPLPFMVIIGLGLLITIGLGVTNLQPIQAALFATPTATATSTPTPTPSPTPGPAQMNFDAFGVAVAEIGYQEAGGATRPSPDGQQLSEWIFNELQREYEQADLFNAHDIQLWHDSMDPAQKGITLGMISNDEEAAELAQQIRADLVIYGTLLAEGEGATFEPRFYIAPLPGEANEIDELTGPFRLGAGVPLELPLDGNDQVAITAARQEVALRARAMRWFTVGFIRDLAGDPDQALRIFKQAEQNLTGWPPRAAGKEILFYFIGREALTLGRDEQAVANSGLYDSVEQALAEAERYFNRALDSNPQYDRGHVGLAGVYYFRAQRQPPEERLYQPELALAIDHYRQGLEYAQASPGGPVELEARFGLAAASRLKGVTHRDLGFPDEAGVYFEAAITETEAIIGPLAEQKQYRTLAQVYLAQGVSYSEWAILRQQQQDSAGSIELYRKAEAAFDRCIAQADRSQGGNPNDRLLNEIIAAYCQPYRQTAEQARLNLEGR